MFSETTKHLKGYSFYSLPTFAKKKKINLSRLPISLRIMLESLIRNCDGVKIKEEDVMRLANWMPKANPEGDVPFIVARVLLQDFTGVPLVVDLAAMRDAAQKLGYDPKIIEPQVPVDLVIDHSVQVDRAGTEDAYLFNLQLEFERNLERYAFLKWGQEAFRAFKVVPPGIGICHQVNLEYLASLVIVRDGVLFPDTLVGTDSHTTMVNGLGVLGWGVGGIEAEAAMLNQPVTIPMPEVIGVHLKGKLPSAVTATDLTLRVTEKLRKEGVVGKFVEFFGEGAAKISVADRATIANMAPEYGATCGFFPIDEKSLEYLKMTGRSDELISLVRSYFEEQELFGMPKAGDIDYVKVLEIDLSALSPSIAGPKRPQDRIPLKELKTSFQRLLKAPYAEGGYNKSEPAPTVYLHSDGSFALDHPHPTGGKSSIDNALNWSESEMVTNRPFTPAKVNPGYAQGQCDAFFTHGSVVIAAITSCTNTSNPSVMIAAGLLAKKAVEKGLLVNPAVKTSLAPGSRVVSDYLENAGLQTYLDALGFQLVGYGCTTCIGNSGPLDEKIETLIKQNDLIAASVLSGNRNFEARIHSSVKANFLMSPPLVVAFAIAGRVDIDLENEPVGYDKKGSPVMLEEIWPDEKEIAEVMKKHLKEELFTNRYSALYGASPKWDAITTPQGSTYLWDKENTYIQNPPYLETFTKEKPPLPQLTKMACLALFGDSVTTDHISPAGAIHENTPAGKYLLSLGIPSKNFNSYGSRRGNHEVMMRGTFANVRIRNKMAEGKEGGFTKIYPSNEILPIFDACQQYRALGKSLIVFAGKDYGMGSSRDWAAKGSALLGVKVVVAQSFERIHRSNLIGMGVLPLEFLSNESHETHNIEGDELFTLKTGDIKEGKTVTLEMEKHGQTRTINLKMRLDTPIEVQYYLHGGIMPYVLREIL